MGIFILIICVALFIYIRDKHSSENSLRGSSRASKGDEKFVESDGESNEDEYEEPDNEMLEVEVYKEVIENEYANIYDSDGDHGDSGGDE